MTVHQTEPASPRHQQAAATRRQLLDAARATFERFGYRAATVGAITDRANTAHGTFYLYFRNKEDAFCQVVESVIVEELVVAATVALDDDRRTAIEQGVRRFLGVYVEHRGLWRALLEGMLQSTRVRQLWLDLRRQFVVRMSNALEADQAAGAVRSLDSLMVAHTLAAMTEWSAFTHLVLGEPAPEEGEDVEALVSTLSDLWYRAVYGVAPGDG